MTADLQRRTTANWLAYVTDRAGEEDPRGGRGWPVAGTVSGVRFEGHVGLRYGRNYLILDSDVRAAAGIVEGDVVEVDLLPRSAPS